MELKPLGSRVIISPVEEEKSKEYGIVIEETAEKERPVKGKVLSVGPGKVTDSGERIPVSVREGDMVLFKKYGPDEMEIEGEKYLVADEEDILAVIK